MNGNTRDLWYVPHSLLREKPLRITSNLSSKYMYKRMQNLNILYTHSGGIRRPPLWPSDQNSWLQIPALPSFLRSSGPATGSTQPRECNWGDTFVDFFVLFLPAWWWYRTELNSFLLCHSLIANLLVYFNAVHIFQLKHRHQLIKGYIYK
jgi:hypothetical protein